MGKTCVLVRFKDGAFLGGNFIATVGIDFRVREMLLNSLTEWLVILFIIPVFVLLFVTNIRKHLPSEKHPNDISKVTKDRIVRVTLLPNYHLISAGNT